MHELSGMFSKIAHYVNEAQYMIERIDRNTDDTVLNVENGMKEVKVYHENAKSNRGLLLKIFFILVFSCVLYIVFVA